MRINHNIAALNTYRQLSSNTDATNDSLEKLSSGLAINTAADNAAGLAISEKMRSQIRGLDQASTNAADGISMISTAEGALSETTSILQRMRELAVQSANDTNTTSDREEMQAELEELTAEVTRIANTTEFNTMNLLDGSFTGAGTASVQETATLDLGAELTAGTAHSDVVLTIGDENYTISFDEASAAATAATVDTATNTITIGTSDSVASVGESIAAALNQLKGSEANSLSEFTISGTGDTLTVAASATGTYAGSAGAESISYVSGLTTTTNFTAGTTTATNGADGTGGAGVLQIGANSNQMLSISISNMSALALGISSTTGSGNYAEAVTANELSDNSGTTEYALDITTSDGANTALDVIDDAIASVSSERSKLGAYQN